MIKIVTLETAIQLKDAGFKQDTNKLWHHIRQGTDKDFKLVDIHDEDYEYHKDFYIASPTSDEILEELPKSIKLKGDEYDLMIKIYAIDVSVWYEGYFCQNTYVLKDNIINDNSLPEALAQMYLWLKAEGLIGGNK